VVSGSKKPLVSAEEFRCIIRQRLPMAALMGIELESIAWEGARLRAVYKKEFLRPGGTIAGPLMMGLADAAMFASVLARIGPVELAVTTQLSINFLRKPAAEDLIADARLLKLGKRLAVGEVTLYSVGELEDAVAHVTATYSIPPPVQRSTANE
jgi:uncharacterized protein (TIGR00369 family)